MSDSRENTIQLHIPPELEYTYRDICNIFVGENEVVFEMGNRHRSTPEHATIANRIVMSIADAYSLQQRLEASLMEAQQRMQAQLQEELKQR